jgi:Zn-dependent peptidase ImmA (M78 family)/transcriptional regulator with XRE-family HTH domain
MTNLPSSKIYHLHEDQFNGIKLHLARERLNISRTELAERVHTSASFVTACEKGRKRPSSGVETLLAAELRVTRQYFFGLVTGRWELSDCHFRHRQAVTKTEKAVVRGQLYFYSRLVAALRRFVRLPQNSLPEVTIYDLRSVEQIASEVRRLWGISPASPIGQLCRLIENAGVIIVFQTAEVRHIDAAAHPGDPAVILVRRRKCGATRFNFDIGHELGELVFRSSANATVEYEKKINRFVGALFMPEAGFAPHFMARPLTISHLWELKRTWGASLSAVVQRALEIGLLSESEFVRWKRRFAVRGWTRLEPNEPQFASPELLRRSLAVLTQQRISLRDFATLVGLSELGLAELLRDNGLGDLMTAVVKSAETEENDDSAADHTGGLEIVK